MTDEQKASERITEGMAALIELAGEDDPHGNRGLLVAIRRLCGHLHDDLSDYEDAANHGKPVPAWARQNATEHFAKICDRLDRAIAKSRKAKAEVKAAQMLLPWGDVLAQAGDVVTAAERGR